MVLHSYIYSTRVADDDWMTEGASDALTQCMIDTLRCCLSFVSPHLIILCRSEHCVFTCNRWVPSSEMRPEYTHCCSECSVKDVRRTWQDIMQELQRYTQIERSLRVCLSIAAPCLCICAVVVSYLRKMCDFTISGCVWFFARSLRCLGY